jgi:hypothetical protein
MDQSQMDQMLDLIFANRQLEAVQLYCSASGTDVETAQQFVEELTSKLQLSHPEAFQEQDAFDEPDIFQDQDELDQPMIPAEDQSEHSSGGWPIWGSILVVIVIRALIQLFR